MLRLLVLVLGLRSPLACFARGFPLSSSCCTFCFDGFEDGSGAAAALCTCGRIYAALCACYSSLLLRLRVGLLSIEASVSLHVYQSNVAQQEAAGSNEQVITGGFVKTTLGVGGKFWCKQT